MTPDYPPEPTNDFAIIYLQHQNSVQGRKCCSSTIFENAGTSSFASYTPAYLYLLLS